MSLRGADLITLVEQLAAHPQRWRDHVRHDASARTFAQIWDAPEANAWLICWSAGHDTGWHDHDDAAAAIAVLDGQVREERLRLTADPSVRLFTGPSRFYVPPNAIHRVRHAGQGPALSIHAYSPPLRRTGAYTIGPRGELERVAQPYERELRAVAAAS